MELRKPMKLIVIFSFMILQISNKAIKRYSVIKTQIYNLLHTTLLWILPWRATFALKTIEGSKYETNF